MKCVHCGQERTGKPEDSQHDVGPRGSVIPYCSQPKQSYPDHRRMCMGCGFPHAFNYTDCVWDKDI